jgi:predicted nucleotidyltransferase
MTTNIKRGETFLGFPATRLKTLLASWRKGNRHPSGLADLKTLSMTSGACAAFLGEAHERGFIGVGHCEGLTVEQSRERGYQHLELTRDGVAILTASAMRRSSKAKAAKVLEGILQRAERLAEDVHAPTAVSQVWVFGSFIDDTKEDVGDLDLVITTRFTGVLKHNKTQDINEQIDRYYPGVVSESTDYYRREDAWLDRMLYGRRRDPLIATTGMHTLVGLHRPCRLVYDAEQGGRITKDYEHHPLSTGRSDTIKERLIIPDLEKYDQSFKPTTASIYMRAPEIDEGWPVVVGARRLEDQDLAHYGDRPLDGCNGFALVVGEGTERALLHIARNHASHNDDTDWEYEFNVEVVHRAKDFDPHKSRWYPMATVIGELFGADILRYAHHRHGMESYAVIQFKVGLCDIANSMPPLKEYLHEQLENVLSQHGKWLLPAAYRFGIDISWDDELKLSHNSPDYFEEEEWAEKAVTKEAYVDWCRRYNSHTWVSLPKP